MTDFTLSPEAFLAQPPDPEEDAEPIETPAPTPTAEVGQAAPRDSLALIADGVQRLVAVVEKHEAESDAETRAQDDYEQLQREFEEIEALHDAKQDLIEQALAILKPSTSKLANNLREVLEPVVAAPAPEPEPEPDGMPAHDADVDEWRVYARRLGHGRTGPAFNELEQMNRSQIRTMLGIPQTGGSAS